MGRWLSTERFLDRQERTDLRFGVFDRRELDKRVRRSERAYRSLKAAARARARARARAA
jgi:hypothetical protein